MSSSDFEESSQSPNAHQPYQGISIKLTETDEVRRYATLEVTSDDDLLIAP